MVGVLSLTIAQKQKKLSHPSTDPSLFLKSKNYEFEVLSSFEVFKRYVLPKVGHQLHDKLLGLTEIKAPNFPTITAILARFASSSTPW
jgi:hypothetical protein